MGIGAKQIEMQSTADINLVHSAKEGETAAFEELMKRHMKRVFAIAWHVTRSREDAEDVTQETFLNACCHLKDFHEKAQFSTWVTRIAVNTALCKVRQSRLVQIDLKREPLWETTHTVEEVPDWRPNPEEICDRSQLRQHLRSALERLPLTYSTVFVLRDVYGFTIEETADALQLSVPTIKTRLLRARLQLRQRLGRFSSHVDKRRARTIEAGRVCSAVTLSR
jgi:RNA polymerase sigma-70 factor (ECF subfamily)